MVKFVFCFGVLFSTTPAFAGELYVAAYNVENLYDPTLNSAGEDDPEFTPSGGKKWDDARLKRKLENLAGVIKKMNNGQGPDVLGVCEVENRAVVEKLAQAISQPGRKYEVVHKDSPSKRGIDAAVIYDAAKLKLLSSAFYDSPPIATRDIVEAEFEADGKRFTVFMNHWPSQANPATDREAMAKRLRRRLDQLLTTDALADVLVMGDLNDEPGADSVKVHLKTGDDAASLPPGAFFNTSAALAKDPGRGTFVFQNKWQTIDQIIVSPGLLDPKGFKWKAGSTAEVKFDEQIFKSSREGQIPRPNRSFTANQFHAKGVSDHLPVGCVLQY